MKYESFSKLYGNVLFNFSDDFLDVYGKEGIRRHLINHVHLVSPDKMKDCDGELFVSAELLSDEYIRKYLEKSNQQDFSAKDCAALALVRYKAPPEKYMSIGSLEKTILELFKKQNDTVYSKRSRGKGYVACVDRSVAEKIILLPEVCQLIRTQTIKAEKRAEENQDDSIEWRAYEFTKAKIEYLESQSMEDDYNGVSGFILTEDKKTHLMVEKKLINQIKFHEFCTVLYYKVQSIPPAQ